jgi:N-acetylglucosaminyl-diphospho-decaprenol L-rhamnosyltransferase
VADVAVAVVSFNERELLAACLRSLEPDVRAGRAEAWVVDNASTDGSAQMVRDEFPWAPLIASEENLGYGAAVNLVAERTVCAWIAPANQDVELHPGALERLLDAGESHPDAAVIAPRLVQPDGATQHSVHPFPTLWLTLLFNLGLHRLSRRLADRLCIIGRWDAERARRVPWAIAAFLLVRRAAFDGAGGFDRDQWLHAEDLDLAWRLHRGGWTTWYEPAAIVGHVGSVATSKAFGSEVEARFMAASYSWMARRRSVAVARAVALANWAGASLRAASLAPFARLRPGRFGERRERQRRWARIHAVGLRPRSELLRRH